MKGFFKETLSPSLQAELMNQAPDIVTIDVDYYSSTKTILEWLSPPLRSGTISYFDDIWSFNANPKLGALAVIHEFNGGGRGLLAPYPVLALSTLTTNCYIYSTSTTPDDG